MADEKTERAEKIAEARAVLTDIYKKHQKDIEGHEKLKPLFAQMNASLETLASTHSDSSKKSERNKAAYEFDVALEKATNATYIIYASQPQGEKISPQMANTIATNAWDAYSKMDAVHNSAQNLDWYRDAVQQHEKKAKIAPRGKTEPELDIAQTRKALIDLRGDPTSEVSKVLRTKVLMPLNKELVIAVDASNSMFDMKGKPINDQVGRLNSSLVNSIHLLQARRMDIPDMQGQLQADAAIKTLQTELDRLHEKPWFNKISPKPKDKDKDEIVQKNVEENKEFANTSLNALASIENTPKVKIAKDEIGYTKKFLERMQTPVGITPAAQLDFQRNQFKQVSVHINKALEASKKAGNQADVEVLEGIQKNIAEIMPSMGRKKTSHLNLPDSNIAKETVLDIGKRLGEFLTVETQEKPQNLAIVSATDMLKGKLTGGMQTQGPDGQRAITYTSVVEEKGIVPDR